MDARRGRSAAILLGCAVAWAGVAQETDPSHYLTHGQLVVWVVRPEAPKKTGIALPQVPPPNIGYREATPSTLGQPASNYGHDAANYGVDADSRTISAPPAGQVTNADGKAETAAPGYGEKTAGSFGQPSSDYGTTAGNYGQPAASLGRTAGNYGTDSSNYGVTVGNFGHSTSNLDDASGPVVEKPPQSLQQEIETKLTKNYPGLRMQFQDVSSGELTAALKRARTNRDYPDVLLFDGFPSSWTGPSADVLDSQQEGASGGPPAAMSQATVGKLVREALVLHHAPHLRTAEAFVRYVEDQDLWTKPAAAPAPPPAH